MLMTICNRYTF
ncbi:protein YtiE [Escherichia coli str. K-12 substr. MG1655]|uniref:Protein YtiE n=1 Tax=Escherichia coli (strain K12) TaxID=83333 RepID=YTIE_ECOLI|nr:protein YtiE [Escherichia coli str. K-12 substr. MG1655] [Escherichia coli]YP_010283920.1 protein YtiE [Escherichia coli str. K-12 substr. MG1655]P0DV22.1 RecName: Full=Protein YtiE [Escherichia coli K-12]UMR55120.1 protein YtiE [Escherichia coli str. K-12 substr. MG1655]